MVAKISCYFYSLLYIVDSLLFTIRKEYYGKNTKRKNKSIVLAFGSTCFWKRGKYGKNNHQQKEQPDK